MTAAWVETARQQFPLLHHSEQRLAYLDNAASSQQPQAVIDAVSHYHCTQHANIHRGLYRLSENATRGYEGARTRVQQFIQAAQAESIIFTRGATEGINLIAAGFTEKVLQPGDDIIISTLEHHANIVPWQRACQKTGANLRVVAADSTGRMDFEHFQQLICERTRLVAMLDTSNTLGIINPIQDVIRVARERSVPVLVDAAQTIAHHPIDVTNLGCDFLVFSGHKIYGPTGIGVLYMSPAWLERLPPYQTGGGMIHKVSFTEATYAEAPGKFEAGTPNISGAMGLAAALDVVSEIGFAAIEAHEADLMIKLERGLRTQTGLEVLAADQPKSGSISFHMPRVHAHDVATILDQYHVAIRAGHHCTMPLMTHLGLAATVRASVGLYNTEEDLQQLFTALQAVQEMFQ